MRVVNGMNRAGVPFNVIDAAIAAAGVPESGVVEFCPNREERAQRATPIGPNLDTSTRSTHKGPGYATTIIDFGGGVVEARAVFVEGRPRLRSPKLDGAIERVPTLEQLEEKRQWAIQRARRSLRYRCLCLQADHLITLTKRGKFESVSECKDAFERFIKIVRKFPAMDMAYVAVPEQHADGLWHVHVAVSGRYDVSRLRCFWYRALGGRGNERGDQTPGSINIRYFHQRKKAAYSVAAYMAKYMGKSIEAIGPGQKSYWCSKGLKPISVEKVLEPYGDCIRVRLFARLMSLAPKATFSVFEWRYIGMRGLICRSC